MRKKNLEWMEKYGLTILNGGTIFFVLGGYFCSGVFLPLLGMTEQMTRSLSQTTAWVSGMIAGLVL